MKTSLAIVLAVAALTVGTATVAPFRAPPSRAGADPTSGAGRPLPTEANQSPTASSAVSCDRNASRSLHREVGWSS